MNKNIILILASFSSYFLTGCDSGQKRGTGQTGNTDTLEVLQLARESGIKDLTLPVELLPWEKAEIHAKVGGYVKTVLVDIGDRVKKDQVLAILDAPEVTANSAKSQADHAAAMAKYHSSRNNYERLNAAAREKGVIAELDLQNSLEQMRSDSGILEAARATAVAFKEMNNYLAIRAPFNGIITYRDVDAGMLAGMSKDPLFKIENIDKLRIQAGMPEIYSSLINDENEIHIRVNAEPDKSYPATFSRRAGSLDAGTRTELWEFISPNPKGELKPGMVANIDLKLKRRDPAFVVPFTALVTNLEKNFVIRLKGNTAEWVDVKNGISYKDKIEIFGLLQEGDLLVLKANDEIKPGMEIYALKK